MNPARNSVRPPTKIPEVGGGPVAKVDEGRRKGSCREGELLECRPCNAGAVFPIGEADATGSLDELRAEEEEQAEMPLCLPSVYQPTRSEYMDHCVTHYPFRAWCKHCLEGRGKEFGHSNHWGR